MKKWRTLIIFGCIFLPGFLFSMDLENRSKEDRDIHKEIAEAAFLDVEVRRDIDLIVDKRVTLYREKCRTLNEEREKCLKNELDSLEGFLVSNLHLFISFTKYKYFDSGDNFSDGILDELGSIIESRVKQRLFPESQDGGEGEE